MNGSFALRISRKWLRWRWRRTSRSSLVSGGQAKLMDASSERLKQADAGANIIHINFNLTEFEGLMEYHALEQYIEVRYQPGKNNYVLIDEVQMCPSFERPSTACTRRRNMTPG